MRYLKTLLVTIGFLVCLSILSPTDMIHASEGQTYEVSTTILNVRDEPSGNAQVVGLLSKGNQVMGFKESYGWVQTYYGGKEAWVAKHHLIPVGSSSENQVSEQSTVSDTSSESITVTATGVNLRSGPGIDYSIISSTTSGNTYNLVETVGDWHQLSLANGSTGWISASLTDSPGDQVAAATTDSQAIEEEQSSAEESTSNVSPPTSGNGSLDGYNIVLDPGHGGRDPGAIGLGGIYEKDLVSSTAMNIADELEGAGANVIITRTGDYFVSLDQRTNISNSHSTHAFVSLHYDSFPAMSVNGMSTYFAEGADRSLAQSIQSSLASTVNLNSRGTMEANFRVLRDTSAPSALVELGFISNPNDLAVVQTADYQNQVATAITNGLKNYFHN